MNSAHPDDPEEYIRGLERGNAQTPEARPYGPHEPRRSQGFGSLIASPVGKLILTATAVFAVAAGLYFVNSTSTTVVQGNLIMLDSGAKGTIDCNDGSVKIDGDNNTYTITGHCKRLEVAGSANHVTAESADVISILGDDNSVTYRTGSPTINKTGNDNTVAPRSGGGS